MKIVNNIVLGDAEEKLAMYSLCIFYYLSFQGLTGVH